jgi:hypothetical protein
MSATSTVAAGPVRQGRPFSGNATVAVVGSVVVFVLAIAGITLLALAVAFPVVVPLVQDQHLPVSAQDLALAKSFASFWWAFGAAGVVSLAGAVFTAVKLIERLDPAPAE